MALVTIRRSLVGYGLAVFVGAGAPATAQDFPTRRILIVAQLAAGTGLDIVARTYAERLQISFGQPVIVENRPGAAGLATAEGVLKSEPDGTTLGVMSSSILAIRPTMFKKPPYDPARDFIPIAHYLKSPFILVTTPTLPVSNVKDLIDYLRAHRGKVSYASPGSGGAPHLAGEYLKQMFDVDMNHVPYRNSPQAITDVAAGHIELTFAEAGASLGLIRDGALRALAVTSTTRLPVLPDVPPFAEAAARPDFEAVSWHMLVAPAATPRAVVDRLHAEMKRIMADPDMKVRIAQHGLIPIEPPPVETSRRYIESEVEKWGKLVKALGLAGSI